MNASKRSAEHEFVVMTVFKTRDWFESATHAGLTFAPQRLAPFQAGEPERGRGAILARAPTTFVGAAQVSRMLTHRLKRQLGLALALIEISTLSCRAPMSLVDPAGPRAALTANLWWSMLALGLTIYLLVMAFLAASLIARQNGRFGLNDRARTRLVVGGGLIAPAVVLLILLTVDLRTLVAVAAPPGPADLTLDVVAHQWWWEVRYPDQKVSTANEIHVPAGQIVLIHLSSVDVIHSLWVPRLAGKTDVVPGQTNTMWLQATSPGEYRGQCAEYCGIQHANMAFSVIADQPDQFQAWITAQQQPAVVPSDAGLARGAQAFASLGCISCHALRYGGTAPTGGGLGPDLTHLASRRTIAAGAAANDTATLERWISNPQALKQGTTMPATTTDAEILRVLAAYLSSLK
jgi:cytochrome c oxidase subunit II